MDETRSEDHEEVEVLRGADRLRAAPGGERDAGRRTSAGSSGVSEATFYVWKKKYAHLGVSELRRLRQLEDENARLKRLVADLTLDKHMLTEALRKKAEADTPPRAGRLVPGDLPVELRAGVSAGAVQSGGVVSAEPSATIRRALRLRIRELAHARPRFGYLRI